MTHIIGAVQHHPGPITLGIFKDMGWNVADLPAVTFSQSASAGSVEAGQVLTYTLTTLNTGVDEMTNVVITDTVPQHTTLISTSFDSGDAAFSGIIAGSVITWTTGENLTTGTVLSRTFAVIVDAELTGVSTITNTAFVTSTAGVGAGSDLYIPVVYTSSDRHNIYLPVIMLEEN
jgi:uncharacterized repeat protein (TIGR01451 family)